jgi:hypothetical protein
MKQPLAFVGGQVVPCQHSLTVQKDAQLAFDEKGAHVRGEWPLAPGGGRPGRRIKHLASQLKGQSSSDRERHQEFS